MNIEVIVSVRIITASGGVREAAVKDTYAFGDNPKWELAGAANAVKQEAARLAIQLHNEMAGDVSQAHLSSVSGTPRRTS